jgi:hypothetical protein
VDVAGEITDLVDAGQLRARVPQAAALLRSRNGIRIASTKQDPFRCPRRSRSSGRAPSLDEQADALRALLHVAHQEPRTASTLGTLHPGKDAAEEPDHCESGGDGE